MTNSESSVVPSAVKANDFQRQWDDIGPSVVDAVNAVGQSGWYILGPEIDRFERELAAAWGRRYAVGVGCGLDAIEIGLRCLGCQPGDKVLMPAVSAFATALAAIKIRAVPVFIDCDEYGLVDLNLAEQTLAEDRSIHYFVPVHLYGHSVHLQRLTMLRQRYDLRVVSDCAQSIGASHHGQPCGTVGDCAATSFYPTKNLGAIGDGGAVLTDSEEIAQEARCLRDYGQSAKYLHDRIGYNSRLDELHAGILRRALLPRLDSWTSARRRVASQYLDGIVNPLLTIHGSPKGSESCWHLFPVLTRQGRKQEFLAHLRAHGIIPGEHYPLAMMDQPAMAGVPHQQVGDCATARDLCAREVSIPIHPYMDDSEVQRVIDACNNWR